MVLCLLLVTISIKATFKFAIFIKKVPTLRSFLTN
jgi:hypothetical protein